MQQPLTTTVWRPLLLILAAQVAVFFVLFSGSSSDRVFAYLGFGQLDGVASLAWFFAALITIGYVCWAATLAPVREHLLRPNLLKAVAVIAAVFDGGPRRSTPCGPRPCWGRRWPGSTSLLSETLHPASLLISLYPP
ncbi:MAG: hypothetical protein AAF648_11695 [Pseudomonadota bacterium]